MRKRKEYICSQISFPYTDKYNKVYESLEDFPIACRGTDFACPCSASDLTRTGKELLHDVFKLSEQEVSGISALIHDDRFEIIEKAPTTYLFRRNFATDIYSLGMPQEWCEYYMGHYIEDSQILRSDFNNETVLYQMKLLLDQHPINLNYYNKSITLPATPSARDVYPAISNQEINAPINLDINAPNTEINILSIQSQQEVSSQVNMTQMLQQNYNFIRDTLS